MDTTELTDLMRELRAELRAVRKVPGGLLSFRQAAKMLGIDRGGALVELVNSGALKAVKIGKRLKIPLGEVQRLMDVGFEIPPRQKAARRPRRSYSLDAADWTLRT